MTFLGGWMALSGFEREGKGLEMCCSLLLESDLRRLFMAVVCN